MKKIIGLFLVALIPLYVSAGPDNIAPAAKVKASSSVPGYECQHVTDGIICIQDQGEWASNSSVSFYGSIDYPWLELEWDTPRSIDRIHLYDRPSQQIHTAGITIHFDDGSRLPVNTIPNDGTAKVVEFAPKTTKRLRFEVTDGDGPTLGLSEIEVFPSPQDYPDYVSYVDPYIESARGRYFFFVTGSRPFGMLSAAPMTRNKNQYGGGYNYNSTEILGFPQVHCWMLSGITLMPATGDIDPTKGEQGWKSRFSHNEELVQPGYHRVFLNDYKLWVEQTCTDRVGFYRMKYTEDCLSNTLLNLGGFTGTSTMTDAEVRQTGPAELEGSVSTVGRLWGGPEEVKIYFVMHFDKPFDRLDSWDDSLTTKAVTGLKVNSQATPRNAGMTYYDAPTAGIQALHRLKKGEELQVKIAISYTNIENARHNLAHECAHWDFDAIRRDARREWEETLSRIQVQGGDAHQRIKFYTDLWHVLLGRHKLDDVSGDYPDRTGQEFIIRTLPKNTTGESKFHMYNSDAFWLTQWNLNILWGLAWPSVLDDFAACLIQYADNGGLLPRGPCGGGYSRIMTGCPATNLIVSAYMKGLLKKTEARHAFTVMKRNHMPGGMLGIDDFYLENGYYADNAGITIEANFQDWALSQMAQQLGYPEEATYFLKRSQGWKQLFDPEKKLIFPQDRQGNWKHRNPLSGDGWVEANAWQATWSVSHGIPDLIELMGGKDVLCDKLNYAFEQAADDDFVYGYSGGYISYANQPGVSNAHVFSWAGKPWLTQYWVRRVRAQAYGAVTPDRGYGGHDEDQGQMGGISALMAIGLFSLTGNVDQNPSYEITSPIFDRIEITLDDRYYEKGKFVIQTYHNSAGNCYIRQARLNGKPLHDFRFSHADFSKGGLLELWMGPEPAKKWGIFPKKRSPRPVNQR